MSEGSEVPIAEVVADFHLPPSSLSTSASVESMVTQPSVRVSMLLNSDSVISVPSLSVPHVSEVSQPAPVVSVPLSSAPALSASDP